MLIKPIEMKKVYKNRISLDYKIKNTNLNILFCDIFNLVNDIFCVFYKKSKKIKNNPK